MRNVAIVTSMFLALALVVPSAHAQSGDFRRAKKAAKLAARDLAALKRFASRVDGAQSESLRQSALRMGLPDQDGDGVVDAFEEMNGTDACSARSDGEHRDGDIRRRVDEISDLGVSSITVGDLEFEIDSATVFSGLSEEDLDIGLCVEVRGHEDDNGDLIAMQIFASDACYDRAPGRNFKVR